MVFQLFHPKNILQKTSFDNGQNSILVDKSAKVDFLSTCVLKNKLIYLCFSWLLTGKKA